MDNLDPMTLFLNIIAPIITLLCGYIFSAIPYALIIGKIFYKQDIRELGSKNPGGTNAIRVWGWKTGVCVIALDMIKAIAPFWITFAIINFTPVKEILIDDVRFLSIWITALGCVLGHCYSVFLKFKGGKGVATYMATLGPSCWLQFVINFVVFVSTISIKKIVSIGSILVCICATVIAWILFGCYEGYPPSREIIDIFFLGNSDLLQMTWAYPIIVTIMSGIVIFRHKQNIINLKNKTEKATY